MRPQLGRITSKNEDYSTKGNKDKSHRQKYIAQERKNFKMNALNLNHDLNYFTKKADLWKNKTAEDMKDETFCNTNQHGVMTIYRNFFVPSKSKKGLRSTF